MPRLAAATKATRSFNPKSIYIVPFRFCGALARPFGRAQLGALVTRRLMLDFADTYTLIEQTRRIIIVNNSRLRLFLKRLDDSSCFIRNSAGSGQATDDFSLIVGDCELV